MGALTGELAFPLGGLATLPGGSAGAAAANSLSADLPGGIGLYDVTASGVESLRVKLRFADPTGMPPSDDLDGLGNLFAPSGLSYPEIVGAPMDFGAVFDPTLTTALEGVDAAIGATALPRDVTVQAIMAWDIAAQIVAAKPGTVIARGRGTSLVEYMPFAIELDIIDAGSLICELRFAWHDSAGVLKTQVGSTFVYPFSPSQFVLISCTRRWVSLTEVVCRYYVNDIFVDEIVSADGDIPSSVDGHTAIGARYTGAAYDNFLAGTIDELGISGYEMSQEEIAATWRRIAIYQPDGYRQMLANMPPGIPISDDPASKAQSDLRSMGIGLGFADGQIENFRENTMPDRSYGSVQRQWEGITEQPARPSDSLDTRRGRVLGHIGSRAGVSIEGVEGALAEILDCNASDLEVIGFDNTIRDDFATLEEERWKITNGGVDVTGGEMRIQGSNGVSYPWDNATPRGGLYALLPVEELTHGTSHPFNGSKIFGHMDPHTLPANSDAGFVFWNAVANSMLFVGLRNVAGSYKVGYQRYEGGVATDASWTVLATTSLAKHYFRLRSTVPQPIEGATEQGWDFSWSTTDFAEASFTTSPVAWLRSFQWAGCYHRSTAALGSASDVRFGDFAYRNTNGTRPFYFYVYRDPALGGSPDIVGANRIIERMRHAYTYARVITSKSLLAGDPASVCDGGPMGGL